MITPEGLCAEHDEINSCDSCAENERERIITLLKSKLDCEFINSDILGNLDHSEHCKACELTALIKGDN